MCIWGSCGVISLISHTQSKENFRAQVHNDLKTKNILLSTSFDIAKIGAHQDLPYIAVAASE